MENFILYEEIGRGSNSIVYKGRRKGTINFLAILCIDKCKRAPITNWVRLTHELNHDNVVKFHEWYETSNHLWLIVELCTGGTLQKVLDQDGFLPEDVIRDFLKDVVIGLKHLHDLGIVFANLCPKKILLDGPGILKITNFGIARLEDENLQDVFEQACAQHEQDAASGHYNFCGQKEYQAPEIIKGENPTFHSDIWSLGIMMYHMFTGSVPFNGGNQAELLQQICYGQFDDLDKRTKHLISKLDDIPQELKNEKASKDFLNLIKQLLSKNPNQRLSMDKLLVHPFWKNSIVDSDESLLSTSNNSLNISGGSQVRLSVERAITPQRGNTAPERVDTLDSTFTLSSRPHTALAQTVDERIFNSSSPMGKTFTVEKGKKTAKTTTESKSISASKSSSSKLFDEGSTRRSEGNALLNLLYHASDTEVSVIQDNPQFQRVDQVRWDAKTLPFSSLSSVDGLTEDDVNNHLKIVAEALMKNPGSQPKQKTNIISYIGHLCMLSSDVANAVINSALLHNLAALFKSSSQNTTDLAFKTARTIGLAACSAIELQTSTKLSDVFSSFCDGLRENVKNTRAKLAILPALGQVLFFVVEQEEGSEARSHDNWNIPSAVFILINRCLREGEDAVVQHVACKVIENVCSISSTYGKRFMPSSGQQGGNGGEVIGALLWTIANRAPNENLKQSAMSALCLLNKLSGNGSVLHSVLEKIGMSQLLITLQKCSVRCMQSLVTAIVETLRSASRGQASRMAAGKNLLPTLVKLLENPSSIVRAKVFLAILELVKKNSELLLVACQSRLVMYIERDIRRTNQNAMDSLQMTATLPINSEYMQSALDLLVKFMTSQAPDITNASVKILEDTSNRKHPTTSQIKQLKVLLPNVTVLMHIVSSQVFRHEVVTSDFIFNLGKLVGHVIQFMKSQSLPSGMYASIGDEICQNFIDSVLTIVECLSQHPMIITQHQEAAMDSLVPRLVLLLAVYNKEGKAMCIKLLNEILGTLLHNKMISQESDHGAKHHLSDDRGLSELITKNLMPEYQPILLGQEPLPVYGVHLLITMVEHWPIELSASVHDNGLIPIILQIYSEQQQAMMGSCALGITTLLSLLVTNTTSTNMMEMYENGLVDLLTSYTVEISCQLIEAQDTNDREFLSMTSDAVVQQLTLLRAVLTFVANDIKKALQDKSTTDSTTTDVAEQLLVINKPLTDLQGLCMQLLCADEEIADLAMANLSLLVQLFGGDHPETMADENMECLAEALRVSPTRIQKILLKAIKRIVNLHKNHAESVFGTDGRSGVLISELRNLVVDGERKADSGLSQIAGEIVECVESAVS